MAGFDRVVVATRSLEIRSVRSQVLRAEDQRLFCLMKRGLCSIWLPETGEAAESSRMNRGISGLTELQYDVVGVLMAAAVVVVVVVVAVAVVVDDGPRVQKTVGRSIRAGMA